MNNFLKIFNDLSEQLSNESKGLEIINDGDNFEIDSKDFDIYNDDDYNKLKNSINTLKDNSLFGILGSLVGLDSDTLDQVMEIVDKQREKKAAEKKEEKIKRPSETISTDAGLKIHKLTQEYIDTMIKPYNPKVGGLSSKAINDAYAGLYEFACWIFQHK